MDLDMYMDRDMDMDLETDLDMNLDLDLDMDTNIDKDIQRFRCQISDIGKKLNPISDVMSDSAVFSPILEVAISGSVRQRSSRTSE